MAGTAVKPIPTEIACCPSMVTSGANKLWIKELFLISSSVWVAAISSARIVVGENSGPMHLANLCGKPTVIWAQDQWRIDFSLQWNPFRVPIYVAANTTCQPAPDLVCLAVVDSLEKLRVLTKNFTVPAYTLPAQKIRGY